MSGRYFDEPRPDVQQLMKADGARILDVGCGSGALAHALRRAGASYIAGAELNPTAAECGRANVDLLIEGNILETELPFAPHDFDYVVFADVLEHLPDPDAALARCLPYLKPDGRVIISVPNMRFYLTLLRLVLNRWEYTASGVRDRTHLRIFTRFSLLRLVERHGLEIERIERNFRLFESHAEMGPIGAMVTRLAHRPLGALLPDLTAYQYLIVAKRRTTR